MAAPTSDVETPTPRRRGRRLIAWIAIVLLGLPLLLVGLGWLALRSPAGRQAVLARISRSYEATSGIRLQAADFSLQFRPGLLVLDDASLATGDADPFLTAESVRVEFDWSGLFGEPLTLRALALERPVADLRQPLPPPGDEPPPRIDVHDLRLVDGRLLGEVAAAGDARPWLTAFEAAGVDVAGSYLDSVAELRLEPARLTLTRAVGEPLELEVSSRVAGPLEGPYRIDDLRLTGEGLRLDADGELGTGEDDPLFLRLALEADPSILVAELEPGARVTANGEIDLRTFRGRLQVAADDFPSEVLEPWIGEAARPGGRPSRLDLDARFTGDPAAARQVTGGGTLLWRQDGRDLVDASFTLTDGRLDEAGVVLDSLVGDVHAEARDLPAELLRPFVDAELLERFAVGGTRFDLTADATVDAAAPAEPTVDVEATWRRGREILATASARTVDEPGPELVLAFAATLLPSTPGRRHLAGVLAAAAWPELAAGELRATRLELELPDLVAAVDDARQRWPRLFEGVDLAALPVTLEGSLAATADVAGKIDAPRVTLDATWRLDDASSVAVTASGEPVARRGEARLELTALALGRLSDELHGLVDGTVTARGEPTDWSAEIDLSGTGLVYGTDMPVFERLRFVAETAGESLRITTLSGRTGQTLFTGDGRVDLPQPLFGTRAAEAKIAGAALYLEAENPFGGIDRLSFRAELADGVVHVERLDVETPNGPGELAAEIPLGALRAFEIDVDAWPVVVADGRIVVDLGFPRLDLGNLAPDVGRQPPWTAHELSLTGRVWIEPGDLTAAEGELLVPRWLLEVDGHRLEVADDPILIALADRKLEVLPVTLRADGRPVDVRASVDLTPGWTPADGFAALVAAIDAHADGVVDAALFTPYLAGGVADGPVAVIADVAGTVGDLDLHVKADGPDARVLFMSPYVTQLAELHLEVIVDGDEIRLPVARARLNEGSLEVDATSTAGDWTFNARFEDVRYRVDYGLSAQLDGRLELFLPAAGRGRLAGEVVVERGVLRRDVDLKREILSVLNAAPDLAGARADPLDAIELDLVITTAEGVRIKNNLADLKADWSSITVQGTLGNPSIEGRIEAAPGGQLTIFGRAAPSDQVALVFSGEPGVPPEVELPTLTAFEAVRREDPSVPRGPFEWEDTVEYRHYFGSGSAEDEPSTQQQLGLGLAGSLGGQIASRLNERLGSIRVQPVLVFIESDPTAKIVISNDLSRNVALVAAIDVRDSQDRTYLLNLHDLRGLPRMSFQVFTNEADNEGGTLEHTLLFGGGKQDEDQVRLRKIRVDGLPEELSVRGVRNAVGYVRNEPLPDGVDFDVEVDVEEMLRHRGYPDADVEARVEPVKPGLADVRVQVAPGHHVVFEFEGDTPPVALRRSITSSYRSDFYEPAALAEISAETTQALHGMGYLEPTVEVVVEPATETTSRTVRIIAVGGRRVRINRVVFTGVDEATATLLRERLGGEAARVELAAGLPEADEWVLAQMRSLGHPEAEVVTRELVDEERELRVALAPGTRQELASVTITGLNDDDRARYQERLPLAAGDVPRTDRVSVGKYLIQNDLKRQGHAEARVRSVLTPLAEGSPIIDLAYEVEPGPRYRLDEVKIEGLQATRPKWAQKVTKLEEDAPLEPARVAEARRLLLGTRLFTSVRSTSERFPDSSTAIVTFDVEEIPRYQLAYGLRWESSEGASVVVDAVDRNFLGRGISLGLRGLYSENDQAGRFYAAKTGIFGRRMAVEYYLQQRHLEEDATPDDPIENIIVTDSVESSVQVSFPIRRLTSRVYARFRREHIREKEPDPFFPFDQTIRFPFIGWQVIHDTRDDLINPWRGLFVSADLSTTNDYIGSDFDFVRLFTQLHWHRPAFKLGRRQLTWSQAYRVGLLTSQDQLPLSEELFAAGGAYSVRGYDTDSLSDEDRGGEALLVINQELRFPIWNVLSGLVFVDAGNAWADKGDFGTDLFTAAGFGLRADTPFGLFRLDLGVPLDQREGDPDYKAYVGFGHAF
jgi:outer membrane protein assembly factor BamA